MTATTAPAGPDFSAADWDDFGSPTWHAMREMAKTDPTSANNVIALWRSEIQGTRSGIVARRVIFRDRIIEQVLPGPRWEKWMIVVGPVNTSGQNTLDAMKRSIERFDRVRND